MKFLIEVNDRELQLASGVGDRIRDVLVDTNVILEAFGNAKTVRNDNSSRFGKYTKLQYSADNRLMSAHTQTFLLEKSRLTSVGEQERNYHIFYQLVKGADSTLDRSALRLSSANDFNVLVAGHCTVAGHEDEDAELFSSLCHALRTLGVSGEEITQLWSALACILHMGNMTVVASATDGEPHSVVSPSMPTEEIASRLGVEPLSYANALLYHIVKIEKRASISRKMLSTEEVLNNILGLMKWMYSGIFNWLVRKVNAAYGTASEELGLISRFIGILDIFGFETLLNNSFEQLCINFANERLQQQFNEQVFVFEQAEYEREGLNWSSISFQDNQSVIDLIAKKPSGLLIVLEEHGMLNRKPDDTALLTSYGQLHHQKHPNYAKPRFGTESFIVKHFAGDVTYSIQGFLAKNNDALQDDLMDLIKTSQNRFLLNVLGVTADASSPGYVPPDKYAAAASESAKAQGAASSGKKMASAVTVSFQFRNQLDDLVATLRATKPHYIKCLKPNATKSPHEFAPVLVMEQLRYSGILEVVRIRREGYPTRMTFREFYSIFSLLGLLNGFPRAAAIASVSSDDDQYKELARGIAELVIPSGGSTASPVYQFGHKKIFLRDGILDKFSSALNAFKQRHAVKLQSWARSRLSTYHYKISRRGIKAFQTAIRRFLCTKHYREAKKAVRSIQTFADRNYRRRKAVKEVEERRRAAALLRRERAQAKINRFAGREYRRRKAAAFVAEFRRATEAKRREEAERRRLEREAQLRLKIQLWGSSNFRRLVQMKRFAASRRAAVKIQTRVRIRSSKKALYSLKKEKFASTIATLVRFFSRRVRNKIISKRIALLTRSFVLDDVTVALNHLKQNPKDSKLLFKTLGRDYRNMLHAIIYFGAYNILTGLKPSRNTILSPDVNGRNCFHHWAQAISPRIDVAVYLLAASTTNILNARGSVAATQARLHQRMSKAGDDPARRVSIEGWLRKVSPTRICRLVDLMPYVTVYAETPWK
jgi:myosin-5